MEQSVTVKYRWTADEMFRVDRYHRRHVIPQWFRILLNFNFAVLLFAGVVELIKESARGTDGRGAGGQDYRVLGITFIVVGFY